MKKEYTIGEICDLYDIGPDSMRYYEKKGLISPKRMKNGYRVYTLEEVSRLNVIKDLRKLGFSVKDIKKYLEDRTLGTTKSLIEAELWAIDNEIRALSLIEGNLKRRLSTLKDIESIKEYEKIEVRWISARKMVMVKETTSKDEEVDLAFRKLESKNKERVLLFGNKDMGAFISHEGFSKGVYNLYENVFFFVDDEEEEYDDILPESLYATLTYRGGYEQSPKHIEEMISHIDMTGYIVSGNPIEIYRVDIHETSRVDEFITEIQIPIIERETFH